jgi:hypothetical protein
MHFGGHARRRDGGGALALFGAVSMGGLLADAAGYATNYGAVLDQAKAQMPPGVSEFVPDVPAYELAQYALDADTFLANPKESAAAVVRSYLTQTIGDAVAQVVTEALTAAFEGAGAALGTAIPVPVLGTIAGAAAGKFVGMVADDFANHNVDRFVAPDGSLIPDVEIVIAAWARPEFAVRGAARSVSEDFHNMGKYEQKGPALTVFGSRVGTGISPAAWPRGILEWADPRRIRSGEDEVAVGTRFLNEIGRAMNIYQTRCAQQASAKAALIARALQIVKNPALARLASGVNRVAISMTQASPFAAAATMLNAATIQAATMPAGRGLGDLILNKVATKATLPAPVVVGGGLSLAALVWWGVRNAWRFF